MSRGARRWLILPAALAGVVALAAAAFVLFFPADAIRVQLEKSLSAASGYEVRIGRLSLSLVGFGVGLDAREVTARSADQSQAIAVPGVRLKVALLPLLRREVRVGRVEADGAVLTLRPAPARPSATPAAPRPQRAPNTPGAVVAVPEIVVTGGRIVQTGPAGTTELSGVAFHASFQGAGTGGTLAGTFSADSTTFASVATPRAPLRFPRIESRFESRIAFEPFAVATTLDGRLGDWPVQGKVNTATAPNGVDVSHQGDITFSPVGVTALKGFLTPGQRKPLEAYELGGELTDARLHFETIPGVDSLRYEFRGRWSGVEAALPGKGRVIDGGSVALHVVPDNLDLEGRMTLGPAELTLTAGVTSFNAPRWRAHVILNGPAREALRFLPPGQAPDVTAGSIHLDLNAAGRVGDKGLPDASGRLDLTGLAFRHPALAVPVDRLDLAAAFDRRSARIERGAVTAGHSDARFSGAVADFAHPAVTLTLTAGTIDLDQLFPQSAAPPPAAAAGKKSAGPAAPVSGDITIDRLIRGRLEVTGARAHFDVSPAAVRLTGLEGTAYGGRVTGDLTLTPAGPQVWSYSGNFDVADVEAASLLSAMTPIRGLEGKLSTRFRVSGENGPGVNPLATLTLAGAGIVFDGALDNIPAVRKVAEALQFKEASSAKFLFKSLRHRLRIENGFVLLDTLNLVQSGADWSVGGKVGLDGRLDCPVTVRLDAGLLSPDSKLAPLAARLAGPDGRIPVTLSVRGTLASPEISLDLDPLLKQAESQAKEGAKEELKQQIKKRLPDIFKKKG